MKININTTCPICGKSTTVEVEYDDYCKYESGELIQKCFPYLSAAEREMLISGICDNCWNKMFRIR